MNFFTINKITQKYWTNKQADFCKMSQIVFKSNPYLNKRYILISPEHLITRFTIFKLILFLDRNVRIISKVIQQTYNFK